MVIYSGVTALCPLARHINPSLLLVQSRKTRPYITEILLMGRKESNQTNKQTKYILNEVLTSCLAGTLYRNARRQF